MTTVRISAEIDMHQTDTWYGTVNYADSEKIIIEGGSFRAVYTGAFTYDYQNEQIYGTLTGYEEFYGDNSLIDVTGINISANYAFNLVQSGNTQQLVQTVLSGNDQFGISATVVVPGNRVLDGYGGYNTLTEPFAYSQYSVVRYGDGVNISNASYTDTLYNIQKIVFSDGSYDIPTGTFKFDIQRSSGDFNGDHKADILWQQTSGATFVWTMDGSRIAAGSAPPAVDPGWTVQAAADISGDGNSDIIWRNSGSGAVVLWAMNGSQVAGSAYLGTVDSSWTIQGAADFSAKGSSDILWRNTAGAVELWTMNGNQVSASTYVGTVDPGWAIQGTGDFNGDGKADILWRNSSSGAVNLWTMNGSDIVSNDYIATVGTSWDIQFLADFNGDGKTDVLWREDTGAVNLWTMDAANVASNDFIAGVGSDWKIAGAGDYTGDGNADVLWRNSGSGAVNLWAMHGSQIAANTYVGSVDNSWAIQHI